MYKDVIHWCKSCHECQLYQQRKLMLEPPRRVSYKIFCKWALYIIGSLPTSNRGKIYSISAVEYVSCCPEARVAHSATSKEMENFAFDWRFGVSLELVTNNGLEFRGNFVKGLVNHFETAHKELLHIIHNVMVWWKLLMELCSIHRVGTELNKTLRACKMTPKLSTKRAVLHMSV